MNPEDREKLTRIGRQFQVPGEFHDGYRIKIGSEHEEALKDHPSWKMIKDKTFHDHGSAMDAAQKIFRHTKTVG